MSFLLAPPGQQGTDSTEAFRSRGNDCTQPFRTNNLHAAHCAEVLGWQRQRIEVETSASGQSYGIFCMLAPSHVDLKVFESLVESGDLCLRVNLAAASALRTDLHRRLKEAKQRLC